MDEDDLGRDLDFVPQEYKTWMIDNVRRPIRADIRELKGEIIKMQKQLVCLSNLGTAFSDLNQSASFVTMSDADIQEQDDDSDARTDGHDPSQLKAKVTHSTSKSSTVKSKFVRIDKGQGKTVLHYQHEMCNDVEEFVAWDKSMENRTAGFLSSVCDWMVKLGGNSPYELFRNILKHAPGGVWGVGNRKCANHTHEACPWGRGGTGRLPRMPLGAGSRQQEVCQSYQRSMPLGAGGGWSTKE
jgi:hypothetical protein